MKLFLCLDDADGMMFNNRRQSRDSKVIEDILNTVDSETLFIDAYSKTLFGCSEKIAVVDDFPDDGFAFSENRDIEPLLSKISSLIVYRWNRIYPNDFALSFSIRDKGFKLFFSTDFPGSSHDKITKEVWVRS